MHADDIQFGRRVEPNGSGTVRHVFSGVPAAPRNAGATNLSRYGATRLMHLLNARPCAAPAGL